MPKEHYVSGEKHQEMQHTSSGSVNKVTVTTRSLFAVVAVVILCGLSFAGGMAYQKHRTRSAQVSTAGNASTGFSGGHGGFAGGHHLGGFGQVTAVSSSSITITNQRTNASTTYTITSSTTITDNGQTVSASDIQTGDTVIITTSGSGSTTATRILVNPSFGGGSGPASSGSDSSGFN